MTRVPLSIKKSLNKHISTICAFSIGTKNRENHCAHFVSHIMSYEFKGVTCKNFTWKDKQKKDKGATIRVNDLFKKIRRKGLFSNKPHTLSECLIFVTVSINIKINGGVFTMGNHPRKHIGILHKGKVWNYSNSRNKVVADPLNNFVNKFSRTYKLNGATVEFYYGALI